MEKNQDVLLLFAQEVRKLMGKNEEQFNYWLGALPLYDSELSRSIVGYGGG